MGWSVSGPETQTQNRQGWSVTGPDTPVSTRPGWTDDSPQVISQSFAAAAAGTLSATLMPTVVRTAPFAGAGALTPAVVSRYPEAYWAADFSGTSELAVSIASRYVIPSVLSGAGSLSALVRPTLSVASPLSGDGALTATATAKMTYTDDFNRANGALVAPWTTNPGGLSNPAAVITTNAAQGGVTSSSTGRQACSWVMHAGQFTSDNQWVRAQLKAPAYSLAADNYTTIFLGANAGLTAAQYFSISTGSGSYLVALSGGVPNGSGGAATGGSRQAASGNFGNVAQTALIEIQRIATSATTATFIAYVNGVEVGRITNYTVSIGAAYRYWGFCIEGNYPFLQSRYASPGIDTIWAGDL